MKNPVVADAREVFSGAASVYLSVHGRREIRLEKGHSRPTLSNSYVM